MSGDRGSVQTCFEHGKDRVERRPSGTSVLLELPLVVGPDAVRAFIWIRRECGHTNSTARPIPILNHTATLNRDAGFTCMRVCRGDGAGLEALYCALVAGDLLDT